MAELHPFRALRYARGAGDPSRLLAPPYDVIVPEEARELRARHPHNAVRLVLPDGEGEDRYRLAARRLEDWRERGILVREAGPSTYVYRQRFADSDGRERTRTALFAELDLVPLDSGEVLPHEETHRGPKEDRMALMEATRAQLSPVFLVARDHAGRLGEGLQSVPGEPADPVLSARTPDGVAHRLWRVPAGERAEALLAAAAADSLLIADGHHRYETALALRDRHPDWEGSGRVLACVVSGRDPGLRILPTHRTLRRPPEGLSWREVAERSFEVERLAPAGPGEDQEAAARAGGGGLVLRAGAVGGDPGEGWRLRPREDALDRAGLAGDASRLGPVVFDALVLREAYRMGPDRAAEAGLLSYHRDPRGAREAAGRRGAVFYLSPVSLEAVWSVCRDRGRLPPKSTYFWPKIPSGLLFRPLSD